MNISSYDCYGNFMREVGVHRGVFRHLLPCLVQKLGALVQVSLGAFFNLGPQFGLLLLQFLDIDAGSSMKDHHQNQVCMRTAEISYFDLFMLSRSTPWLMAIVLDMAAVLPISIALSSLVRPVPRLV